MAINAEFGKYLPTREVRRISISPEQIGIVVGFISPYRKGILNSIDTIKASLQSLQPAPKDAFPIRISRFTQRRFYERGLKNKLADKEFELGMYDLALREVNLGIVDLAELIIENNIRELQISAKSAIESSITSVQFFYRDRLERGIKAMEIINPEKARQLQSEMPSLLRRINFGDPLR